MRLCGSPGCPVKHHSRGLCRKHFYQAHRQHILMVNRRWNKANPEKLKASRAKYLSTDKGRNCLRATLSARSRRVRRATPPWQDIGPIREVYRNKPDGYQVDHIIPLKGKTVSGLHVPWNLQYLTPAENSRKGNKIA